MDFGGRSLLNRTSNKEYRFAHYSIQEFFVANATCTNNLKTDLVNQKVLVTHQQEVTLDTKMRH